MIQLSVTWKRIWYNPRYERGQIQGDPHGVNRIYRHRKSGQIRLYSDLRLEGAGVLSVNGEAPVTLTKRGRFGKLYLGFRED